MEWGPGARLNLGKPGCMRLGLKVLRILGKECWGGPGDCKNVGWHHSILTSVSVILSPRVIPRLTKCCAGLWDSVLIYLPGIRMCFKLLHEFMFKSAHQTPWLHGGECKACKDKNSCPFNSVLYTCHLVAKLSGSRHSISICWWNRQLKRSLSWVVFSKVVS